MKIWHFLMTLRSLFSHAPQTASISPHSPVISRAFKRNFNYKQFSPDMLTSKPNLQVSCNFSRWEQSGSTENSRPGSHGLRNREWVGRENSAKQMYSEKQTRNDRTEFLMILLPYSPPFRDKAAAQGYPSYVFNNYHASPSPSLRLVC